MELLPSFTPELLHNALHSTSTFTFIIQITGAKEVPGKSEVASMAPGFCPVDQQHCIPWELVKKCRIWSSC